MSDYDDYLIDKWANAGDMEICAHDDARLTVPTSPAGSESAVHPGVVYFSSGWNGYDYWMAFTPLAAIVDENPEIVASDDGLTWEVPDGLTNPIDGDPGTPVHNSDTDLFYDSTADELWCYYREINPNTGNTNIQLRTSDDGTTWSAESTVLNVSTNDALCPTVWKVGSTYYLWVIDSNRDIQRYDSTDGATWGNKTACTTPIKAWNIHIRYHSTDSTYYCLINDREINGALAWMESSDGLVWTLAPARQLVLQRGGMWPEVASESQPWDGATIYRASFIIDGSTVRIWYSGRKDDEWGIGYTSVALSTLTA